MSDKTTLPDDSLLEWREVASRLGLKKTAFWHALYNDDMPHYRLNARVFRFRWSEVEKWLQKRAHGSH